MSSINTKNENTIVKSLLKVAIGIWVMMVANIFMRMYESYRVFDLSTEMYALDRQIEAVRLDTREMERKYAHIMSETNLLDYAEHNGFVVPETIINLND